MPQDIQMKTHSTCCISVKPPISLKTRSRNRKNLSLDIQNSSPVPLKFSTAAMVTDLFSVSEGKTESCNETTSCPYSSTPNNRSTFDLNAGETSKKEKLENQGVDHSKIYSLASAYKLSGSGSGSGSSSNNDNTNNSITVNKVDHNSNTSNTTAATLLASSSIGLTKKRMLSLSIKTQGLDNNSNESTTHQVLPNLRLRSKTIATLDTSASPLIHIGTNNNNTRDNDELSTISQLRSTEENFDNGDTRRPELFFRQSTYPQGPLLVIKPNIYLYSEPRLDEILKFDVIVNVGTEVPNLKKSVPAELRENIDYYHIRWTHNTKITKDLEFLTSLIHTASLQNKKVLVHCQCGVSRSASLIIAYIMRYDNLTLNDAYNKLKAVARDISPNMGLIFQLVEWSEKLEAITGRKLQSNTSTKPVDLGIGIGNGMDMGVADGSTSVYGKKEDIDNACDNSVMGNDSISRVKTPLCLCSCDSSTNSTTSSSLSSCFTPKTPSGLEIPATFSTNTTVTTTSSANSSSEETASGGSSANNIIAAPKGDILKNIYSCVG